MHLDISCPKKRCKSKYKFPIWWNPDLSKMIAKLRFLAKKKSSIGKNAYKTLRREYKSAIAKAKIDGWNKFTSEIDNPSDVSKLIRTFNNNTNNALGLLKNDQGELLQQSGRIVIDSSGTIFSWPHRCP